MVFVLFISVAHVFSGFWDSQSFYKLYYDVKVVILGGTADE